MKHFNVLCNMQYKISTHYSQWRTTKDFDISELILFILLEGTDFFTNYIARLDLQEVRSQPHYVVCKKSVPLYFTVIELKTLCGLCVPSKHSPVVTVMQQLQQQKANPK